MNSGTNNPGAPFMHAGTGTNNPVAPFYACGHGQNNPGYRFYILSISTTQVRVDADHVRKSDGRHLTVHRDISMCLCCQIQDYSNCTEKSTLRLRRRVCNDLHGKL